MQLGFWGSTERGAPAISLSVGALIQPPPQPINQHRRMEKVVRTLTDTDYCMDGRVGGKSLLSILRDSGH